MRTLNIIAMALLIIGGLNWLLVGLFEFDLVAAISAAKSVRAAACRASSTSWSASRRSMA